MPRFMTKEWMQNFRPNETSRGIKVGGKSVVRHEGVGNLPILFKDKDGNVVADVVLKDVKFAKGFGFNLFSLTKAIMQDWKIQSEGQMITVSKGQSKIVFDIQIDTGNGGMLLCAFVEPKNYGNNVAMIAPAEKGTKMSLMKAHQLLGHPNEELTRKTSPHLGWSITRGRVLTCENSTIAKARQKNIPKDPEVTEPVEKGQLLHLDLMSVKVPKGCSLQQQQMQMIVDAYTRIELMAFYEAKSEMPDNTCRLLQSLKEKGINIQCLRMDNAGENKELAKQMKSKDWKFAVVIEYTARAEQPRGNSICSQCLKSNSDLRNSACPQGMALHTLSVGNGVYL